MGFSPVLLRRMQTALRRRMLSGTKVTKARLYPALKAIIRDPTTYEAISDSHDTAEGMTSSGSLSQHLDSALNAYVFDRMPIRLLALPSMELIERSEIVQHIKTKMNGIDETCLAAMLQEVDRLAQIKTTEEDAEEEDAREDPVQSIFNFLFSEYGRYAILSHTWLNAELRYQHTLAEGWQSVYEARPGYRKIRGFCDVAQQYGVSLAWVDTVCINKDSSAELDESIRSMYQWYHDASICMTYLHHTSISDSLPGELSPSTQTTDLAEAELRTVLAKMAHDRWFTRGWTLQELLAPIRMKFYDANWQAIRAGDNDKEDSEIQELITSVTGIEREDIVSFDPLKTRSSIIERMVWATKRKTTRGEDRAYSLMGVFGVRLSIAYGEGAESAFFRLVEKILTSRETSQIIQILAWGGKPISDQIHPSRLIPSSPECYLYRPYAVGDDDNNRVAGDFSPKAIAKTCGNFPRAREAITLTHLGLRVRLLLIKTSVSTLESFGTGRSNGQTHKDVGPFEVTIWCLLPTSDKDDPSQLTSKILTNIDIEKRYSYPPDTQDFGAICETAGHHIFFIGIYTFTEDEEYVNFPSWYCAVLLGIPFIGVEKDFSMQTLTPDDFQPYSKISTRTILHLDNFKQSEVIRVKKSDHRDIMKVLTVSL